MAYKIYSDKDLSQEQWDNFMGDSFFLSTQFASLWRAKKGEPLYYLDEEDGAIKAGIGGVVFGKGLFKRFDSMPDGLYGGPFFAPDYDSEKRQKFLVSFGEYIKSNNYLRANINKPEENISIPIFETQTTVEQMLELSSDEYIPSKKEVRKHIRGSKERGGLVEGITNKNDLNSFYKLALKSEKCHFRKLIYPKEFFRRLLELSKVNKKILWLKVTVENKMIASQITFFEKDKALNWAFYFDKNYSFYKPAYLLVDYALNHSIKNDIKYFSMGATPENIESVKKYKERWGCVEQFYNNYTYRSFLGRLICGWRRR
ncbi:MAG: GNAT family N-acetyltransferase [candidate division Zixibacteria bacterium]|nr:GNAT family N-acetyltransferase [candidate division Zixibacteria bacterium]